MGAIPCHPPRVLSFAGMSHPPAAGPTLLVDCRRGGRARRFPRAAALLAFAALLGAAQDAGWSVVGRPQTPRPPLPLVAGSAVASLANAEIFTQQRFQPMRYRFAVPDGTYLVRLHYLQAPQQGATGVKNNGELAATANGIVILDRAAQWIAGPVPTHGAPDREVPAGVVPKVAQGEVVATGGTLDLVFPYLRGRPRWAVNGIEVIGAATTLRVRCGSADACTDADGNRWEPDAAQARPIPTAGEIVLTQAPDTKATWVQLSDEIFARLSAEIGVVPTYARYLVGCDHAGGAYVVIAGLGCWRLDWPTRRLRRVDGGGFTGDPLGPVEGHPAAAGLYLLGQSALSPGGYAARTLDGERFEPIVGFPAQNGIDWASIDWSAAPHVVFVKLHHTPGRTAVSIDGGASYRQLGDDGAGLVAIGALGGGVLVKCMRNGAVMRSVDLGVTWTEAARVAFTSPPKRAFIARIGARAVLHTIGGELCLSDDAGASWRTIAGAPRFRQPVARGRDDRHVVGFGDTAAFESIDGGETWREVVALGPAGPPALAWVPWSWSYDAVADAFYCVNGAGDIWRYAR